MTASVIPPFPLFADRNGVALATGFIYIGSENLNPMTAANRIAVYSDRALTVPLAQPVSIVGGYAVTAAGAPTNVYAATAFAMTVTDRNNTVQLTSPSYGFAVLSAAITFGDVVVSVSLLPDAAGGAFIGSVTLPFSLGVFQGIQVRDLSIYQDDQPAVAADLARMSQLMMPLAGCIYRTAGPTLTNAFNVATVTVNGTGDYNVNLIIPAPAGNLTITPTADTPVRQAIADIDAGRTFIHVTTFNTNTGAAAASGFHLSATCDAAVADPIS